MGWTKRLIEYSLVVLVAIIVSMLLIWIWSTFFGQGTGTCANCGTVSLPRLRAECDKQFYSSGSGAKQLEAQWELEELVAFVEPTVDTTNTGFSSSGTSTAQASGPVVREPGYLMIRLLPQQYSYATGQSNSSGPYSDVSAIAPETNWNDVTVTVARRVNQLRNEQVCSGNVKFRDGRFEFFCDIPTKFGSTDFGQLSYFVYLTNQSSVPLEYCVISNCDASSPWGAGTLCQAEQPQQ